MLSKKEASALLRNVNFPGEDVTDLSSLGVSDERKRIIRERRSDCFVAAAIEIQRLWRGHRTRRLFKEILGPVLKDVGGISSNPLPPIIEDVRLPPRKAAEIIQRAWRRFNNTKVYRFYRDLINFNGRGEPSLMLRCINPKEASLLDQAAGVRVRFRLGGETFPPNVYYKIFTYRNIVDLCASSPRDYTVMQHRRLLAGDVHNKVGQRKMEVKTDGGKNNWYQRWENNGWRLVPTRLFAKIDHDSIQNDTSLQKREFPHSKLKRKEDVERRKKERKIQWLKKLYKQGMMDSHELDGLDRKEFQTATEQMMDVVERGGVEMVEEDDVDELLSWTKGLNFDDYSLDWQVLGTSTTSEETDIHEQILSGDLLARRNPDTAGEILKPS